MCIVESTQPWPWKESNIQNMLLLLLLQQITWASERFLQRRSYWTDVLFSAGSVPFDGSLRLQLVLDNCCHWLLVNSVVHFHSSLLQMIIGCKYEETISNGWDCVSTRSPINMELGWYLQPNFVRREHSVCKQRWHRELSVLVEKKGKTLDLPSIIRKRTYLGVHWTVLGLDSIQKDERWTISPQMYFTCSLCRASQWRSS